ncbi:unnamed protein product, partial [Didymodactylos carnosus]
MGNRNARRQGASGLDNYGQGYNDFPYEPIMENYGAGYEPYAEYPFGYGMTEQDFNGRGGGYIPTIRPANSFPPQQQNLNLGAYGGLGNTPGLSPLGASSFGGLNGYGSRYPYGFNPLIHQQGTMGPKIRKIFVPNHIFPQFQQMLQGGMGMQSPMMGMGMGMNPMMSMGQGCGGSPMMMPQGCGMGMPSPMMNPMMSMGQGCGGSPMIMPQGCGMGMQSPMMGMGMNQMMPMGGGSLPPNCCAMSIPISGAMPSASMGSSYCPQPIMQQPQMPCGPIMQPQMQMPCAPPMPIMPQQLPMMMPQQLPMMMPQAMPCQQPQMPYLPSMMSPLI